MSLELLQSYGLHPKRIEVLDSSMLGDFCDCPSMFYLRHILGLKGNHGIDDKVALDWGTCWHKGMYAYYENYEGSFANLEAALTAITENFPDYINPTNDPKTKRSKKRMLEQMVAYHKKWEVDNRRFEILRREQFFDVYSDVDDLRWCGRMDSIRRQAQPDKIQVWDYKSTSAMGDRYFDSHELSFQFPGYVWACNQMLTEEVIELKMDVMYTLSGKFEFFRRTFRYDSYRRAEFVQNARLWVERIMELQDKHLYNPEMWNKNYKECTRYNTCSFFKVHNLHPKGDTRFRILQNDYHEERWDPSAIED